MYKTLFLRLGLALFSSSIISSGPFAMDDDPFKDQIDPFGGGRFFNPERVRQEKEKYSFLPFNGGQ